MKNAIYKIYELEEVLTLYINANGISEILDNQNIELSIECNNENSEIFDEEIIDIQIEKDFLDDIDILENETIEERNKKVKRYQKIVRALKKKYNYKCQLCGYTFHMDNGMDYCEAHHIKMLSQDGSQSHENVIILCPNHHRMFHYAANIIIIENLIDNKRTIKIGDQQFVVQF